MKNTIYTILITLSLILSASSFALANTTTISGAVEYFSGQSIETGDFFEFYAVRSGDQKVLLPEILNGKQLVNEGARVSIQGEITPLACIDMSYACADAEFATILSIDVSGSNKPLFDVFSGSIKPFEKPYAEPGTEPDWVLEADGMSIIIPDYIDLKSLYTHDAEVLIEGELERVFCQDLDGSCPSARLENVTSFSVNF